MDERQAAINPGARSKWQKFKRFMVTVLVILLIAGVAAAVYFWQQQNLDQQRKQHEDEVKVLNTTIEALKNDIGNKESDDSAKKDASSSLATVKDAVSSAVNGKTYAVLSTHMANPVNVVLAASEGIGKRTPAQAVEDLKYLNNAKGTWSFDMSASTLTTWKAGPYARYVPENGIIGLSSDDYVVTFAVSSENKITEIFMSSQGMN